jgi:hypothetical protein
MQSDSDEKNDENREADPFIYNPFNDFDIGFKVYGNYQKWYVNSEKHRIILEKWRESFSSELYLQSYEETVRMRLFAAQKIIEIGVRLRL